MKCEFKQVCRGIAYGVQSSAAAAEAMGEFTAYAVSFGRTLGREALVQCSNNEDEEALLRAFVSSSKFEDKMAAGDYAAQCLIKKWNSED